MLKSKIIEYALALTNAKTCETVKNEIAQSPEATENLTMIENTLSAIASSCNQHKPSDALLGRLLKSTKQSSCFDGFVDRLGDFLDLDIESVNSLLANINSAPARPWKTTGINGIFTLPFSGGSRLEPAECSLIYMQPKACFPEHSHSGDEWGFILQGQVEEGSGKAYQPGDIVHKTKHDTHLLRVTSDEPFVFAVVLYGGVELLK